MTDNVDAWDMTADQVAEQLSSMSKAYLDAQPVDPQAALDKRYADPEFRQKLDSGSPAAREEFDRMVTEAAAADPVKAAMAGQLPEIPSSDLRLMANMAGWLREIGISEGAIEQALSGAQEPAKAFEAVKQWKGDHLSDPEWVKRLLGGGEKERRELVLCSIVLAAGPKEKAA